MRNIPLLFPFALALLWSCLGGALIPWLHLLPFAPFLVFAYMRCSFPVSLWWALLSGLIIDLMSSQMHFGLHALNYCLTTLAIYTQRKHFFEDKPIALSVFTALFASTSTLLQLLLFSAFERHLPFNWKSLLSDLFAMSILDGIFAFIWFTLPMKLYLHIRKTGWRALFKKSS